MVPETIYVVQTTHGHRSGRTEWSISEANAERIADEREEEDGVTSVIVYAVNLPDLIDGALDDLLNGEHPAPDLTINREYRV